MGSASCPTTLPKMHFDLHDNSTPLFLRNILPIFFSSPKFLFKAPQKKKKSKAFPPCSEEINCDTSSTLHWAGLAGRQLGAKLSVGSVEGGRGGGGGWWHEEEEAGERDMGSSSSSSPLDSSSEWLDSERHCGAEKKVCV